MNKLRIAINGFGRIGRCVFRALVESNKSDIELVAINVGIGDISSYIHLLKYDSTHGIFNKFKIIDASTIEYNSKQVKILVERDPKLLNWGKFNVDIVLECSGVFTNKSSAMHHINAGAKKVIISAPGDDVDRTVIFGVNHKELSHSDRVISVGSCTTNCLAPVALILDQHLGIESGFMTTIHSYTNDQSVLDGIHKDKRRARTCALSMIPSSTGAAKALRLVLPSLNGKLDGTAIRVPTHNVSMIDLAFTSQTNTSVNHINSIIKEAVESEIGQVLACTDEEMVSIDFNHNPMSSTFDLTQTKVVNQNFCRIVSWYDNEWGFSNRMLDVTEYFGNMQ